MNNQSDMLPKILIWLQEEQCALAVLDVAISIAQQCNSHLIIVYAIDKAQTSVSWPGPGFVSIPLCSKDKEAKQQTNAEQVLQIFTKRCSSCGISHETKIVLGNPVQIFQKEAALVNLVVMEKPDRRRQSFIKKVLRKLDLPLLIVPCRQGKESSMACGEKS